MKSDKITFQIQFWAFIGPYITLLSFFVFLVKGTIIPTTLPLVLLLGVPLCWKWKLKGFCGSVVLLSSLLFYSYTDIPLDDRFWHLGMGVSIAISLLITALSFEEVEALVEGIGLESRSRLENLWKVDEKLQHAEGELKKKKDRVKELTLKIRSYQKLVDRSAEELIELRAKHDTIAQELEQSNNEKMELKSQLTQALDSQLSDDKYLQLNNKYEEKEVLLDKARKDLLIANEQLLNLQREHEERVTFELNEVEQILERKLVEFEKEQEANEADHQLELDTLQGILESILQVEKK